MPITEADTCRKYVLPKLYAAHWNNDQISEQRTFTDGRIEVFENKSFRKKGKRADYILSYRRDFMIAVIEAKSAYETAGKGMLQAKDYAKTLGLKFAYSTNGKEIIEYDFLTGKEIVIDQFPTPDDLMARLATAEGFTNQQSIERWIAPGYRVPGKPLRYYQEIAINRVVKAVLSGQKRILLTMATGTGKTLVAFQIVWKLWNSRWNVAGEYRKPKILYLADRSILVDDPKDKMFAPLGDARHKIEGVAKTNYDVYFATYQAIAEDERRLGLFREYSPDFFDLIVVDECHRGSAKDENCWRMILEYFKPAYQLGMTATPLRRDNRTTYRYFGNPVYIYSLRDGIQDGFLAPYRVRRIVSTADAEGWRPTREQIDKYGRTIPDKLYGTPEFEKIVSLKARTEAVARHITDYMKENDRCARTIVFCVDQEHADEMRRELSNLNSDLMKTNPNYVVRIVSDEGELGKGFLYKFMDVETKLDTPIIVTTSQLLTTGVDVPICKNIVLFRVINSMTDFKQIIGRGTRVRDDYNKLFFTILDYTGSATRLFADPEFDGEPVVLTQEEIDEEGNRKGTVIIKDWTPPEDGQPKISDDLEGESKKFYVEGGEVEIIADTVFDLDQDGRRMRAISYTDYTGKEVRTMFTSMSELRSKWSNSQQRKAIIEALEEKGISMEHLLEASKNPDADPFDLLCNFAFNATIKTRRERAERVRKEEKDFLEKFKPQAREILSEVLDKYISYGATQLNDVNVLKVPPISMYGNVLEIAGLFGGPDELRSSLDEMQTLLYTM